MTKLLYISGQTTKCIEKTEIEKAYPSFFGEGMIFRTDVQETCLTYIKMKRTLPQGPGEGV